MANLRTILANVCSVPHRQGDSGHPWADLTCVCAAEYSKFGLSLDIGGMGVEGSVPAQVTDVTPTSAAAPTIVAPPPPPPLGTASAGRRLTAAPRRASYGAFTSAYSSTKSHAAFIAASVAGLARVHAALPPAVQ